MLDTFVCLRGALDPESVVRPLKRPDFFTLTTFTLVKGPEKFVRVWVLVLAYEVLGAPFSFRKLGGGPSADSIGYRLSYQTWTVGILRIDSLAVIGFQTMGRAFANFVGRANFMARVLTWMKPCVATCSGPPTSAELLASYNACLGPRLLEGHGFGQE